MDEVLYNALTGYYSVLGYTGYLPDSDVHKLLLLGFYRDFMFQDYRGLISKEDYLTIERALNCLYGTSCLIPYPDYLKMGKLHLGEMSEMAQRVKNIEDTEVLKSVSPFDIEGGEQSDIVIMEEE